MERTFVGYWDKQAPGYDQKLSGIERRLFPSSRDWVCGRARGSTLELGIGTAANLDHYPGEVTLTGVDWSAEMLTIARRRAERSRRAITVHQGDAADLPWDDDAFDTVVATFSLCCIPDLRGALTEGLRVLRPGGRLLLADHIASSSRPIRILQRAAELISVPLHGEHFTRRPLDLLRELDVTIVETERRTRGIIEHVHARAGI